MNSVIRELENRVARAILRSGFLCARRVREARSTIPAPPYAEADRAAAHTLRVLEELYRYRWRRHVDVDLGRLDALARGPIVTVCR
jgi:hypothetical protein